MSTARLHLITLGAGLVIGGLLVYKLRPPEVRVETKEVVKTQTVTKIRRIKQPDGTVITEKDVVKNENKERQKLKTEKSKATYKLGVYAYSQNWEQPEYGLMLQKRIFGDVFVFGALQQNEQISLGVAIEF